MMFMWMIGYYAYHLPRPTLKNFTAWVLITLFLLVAVGLMMFLPDMPNQVETTRMHWADKFISDFIVSLFIALAFWIMPDGKRSQQISGAVLQFRKIANLTYPIYVFHFPFLNVSIVFLRNVSNKLLAVQISFVLVLATCALLGLYFESKKGFWLQLFKKKVSKLMSSLKYIRLRNTNLNEYRHKS